MSTAGSTWARNPIPRVNTDNIGLAVVGDCTEKDGRGANAGGRNKPICQQFKAPCPQDTGTYPYCAAVNNTWPCSYDGSGQGACSGDWTAGLIADKVTIPKTLKPGSYVLGWRYDCEETAQIWQNCTCSWRCLYPLVHRSFNFRLLSAALAPIAPPLGSWRAHLSFLVACAHPAFWVGS